MDEPEGINLQAQLLERARKSFPPLWVISHDVTVPAYPLRLRTWWGVMPEPRWTLCASLEAARRVIQMQGGCVKFARQEGDPADVVETWL